MKFYGALVPGKWTGPAPKDGRTSPAAEPQLVLGDLDRVKSSSLVPFRVMYV
jgi:hypothetical protein